MGKIVLLDDLTINQIAAGEVIERPASVVKELIENSIDAGATKIDVEVQNGGIKKIRIIDNGCGMAEDDLEFAFERHATSKIRTAEDLETVKSMGFRGEALASVAAISNVELITKREEDNIGHRIVVEGGDVIEKGEAGSQKGTSITITNLFYNTPVRYKFLKKDYTELGYIEDAVTRIALANPNIAIKLKNENKTIIQTNGNGDIRTVIYGLYGKETSEALIDVDYQYEDIKVTGVIGRPNIARSNRTYQMFFVNKRFIKDKTLTSAAEQAFKGLLPIGKFGFIILDLELDQRKIDVNVHPTKLEIRFQEEQKVFKAVYHAIRDSLLKADLIKNAEKEPKDTTQIPIIPNIQELVSSNIPEKKNEEPIEEKHKTSEGGLFSIFKKKDNAEEIKEENENVLAQIFNKKSLEKVEEPTIAKIPENTEKETINSEIKENKIEINEETEKNVETNVSVQPESTISNFDFNEMYSKTFGKKIEEPKEEVPNFENISIFEDEEKYEKAPEYKYCGTVFSTYIVIEMKNEMYIIDQHAAHERIMYEKIKKNYYSGGEKDSQILLLPDIINLTHKEKAIVKENIDMFTRAGFMIEEFGENTIRLIGVPTICMELDTKELFLQILDAVNTVAITAIQEKEDKFIATIACKAAVKANHVLGVEEVKELMDKLLRLPNPFTCPHGRPTAIKMSKYDIERKFNRK